MSIDKILADKLNETLTENGDIAYESSGSYCLDFFVLSGASRFNYSQLFSLFIKAYNEDPKTAVKILFYLRDIRQGLGERNSFRFLLNVLANFYPNIARQVLEYIPSYGRYDDLLVLLNSQLDFETVNLIKRQLTNDIENYNNKKEYSLLSKWLPSINASNPQTRSLANLLCQKLGMSKEEYRQTLSKLRKYLIENNLRTNNYTFDYSKVPGRAFNKYKKAFYRNDGERFREFMGIDDVELGAAIPQIHSDNISPYELVRELRNSSISGFSKETLEKLVDVIWSTFKLESDNSKTLIVRDGSGSMTWSRSEPVPCDVADAFTLLYSEKLTGIFHNKFITFSSRPKFVELKSETLSDKLKELLAYDDCTNTNIEKVYQLIINAYKDPNFKKGEDEIDRIVIISDMEFDECCEDSSKSTFDMFKKKFSKIGYKMPEMVFLNVNARSTHLPVKYNEAGVKLIGGSSKNILDLIVKNSSAKPVDFMYDILKTYDFVDNIDWSK